MSEDANITKEELEATARAAFDEQTANLNAEDIDDDQVKLAMLQVGVPFSSVTRLFNQFMIDAGFALSREERDEMIERVVGGADDIESQEGFEDVVSQLVDEGNGVITERMAGAMIRGYAKKNELNVYRKQPGGGGGGGGGFRNAFFELLRANPRMSSEEFEGILANHEKASDNVRNNRGHYDAIRKLVNDVAS